MKKLLLCAALLPAFAHAADSHYCSLLGTVYQNAANMRDQGNSPDMALQMTAAYREVDEVTRKKAINLVYFDPRFTQAGGYALQSQVMQACMGVRQYQPLK
jgi:hypothetical protein